VNAGLIIIFALLKKAYLGKNYSKSSQMQRRPHTQVYTKEMISIWNALGTVIYGRIKKHPIMYCSTQGIEKANFHDIKFTGKTGCFCSLPTLQF
jgi:hypothetical protein